MTENQISRQITDSAIETHTSLGGPGLLESVYEEALAWELAKRKLSVDRQTPVAINYKGVLLAHPLRLDLLVEGKVIVEVKTAITYHKVFEAQALTYLRITGLKLALVINFGESRVANGIHRVVNGL